jgi:hypothetical protein
MRIPDDDIERDQFYTDLVLKCMASKDERSRHYASLRNYYLFGGAEDDNESPYNKIFPQIDLLTSFLFSADTTKFAIHIGADVPSIELPRINVLSKSVHDAWLSSNADIIFGQAVTWSLVYNTMIVKLVAKNGELHPFLVEPQCFGVLREDVPFIDRQEAMVHTYYTTKSQLEIDVENHPHKADILSSLTGEKTELASPYSGMERIMVLNTMPNISGNVNIDLTDRNRFIPTVDAELVEMQELWVFDEKLNDYRVVTRASNRVTIYDRKNIFIDNEVPFVQVCSSPLYNYFWGSSEVDRMTGLQRWRNERIAQMRRLLAKQVDPPKSYSGMGIPDEKLWALNEPGGFLNSNDPMGKAQEFPPAMPPDLFREIGMIDDMFSEQSGLQNLLMGKGESGVRSGKQTSELARLGSARIKKRSLTVEDSLEKMATLYLKFLQVYDDKQYVDSNGLKFSAKQFTTDYVVKVDGHSNSPLFVEDHKSMAEELFKAKAIDRARLVEMLDPPGKENILVELKAIEKKEAEAAAAHQKMEMEMHQQKKGVSPQQQVK